MVDKALKGMIDIILVKSISRFGRNIVDVIGAINKLRTMGVEVYFERENISSLDVTSTIALSMYAQLAESEAISMSQNMTWAIDKRMKAGKYYIPVNEMLGYRYDSEGNLYIVESEARIIREIFSMYIQGLSLLFIARTMMENKEKTPIRIICPGKVYRRDDDATHSHQFGQVEGLVIDKNISLADLKGTLEVFVKKMLGV